MKISQFKVLTFDCYGTLIDWESGLFTALQPLIRRAEVTPDRDVILAEFARFEVAQQEATPDMPYAVVLTAVHARLAHAWGVTPDPEEDRRFGASVPDWPAFPDSADALRYLKQHFRLVILSNVDRASFRGSNARLGVAFDAVYTAQDIGSYKPDIRNFNYMLDHLAAGGVTRDQVLHVAQSLFHDHAPANRVGLASAWIDRRHASGGWGATAAPPPDVHWDMRFLSLGELAEAHARELAAGT
jgi:2-haloalkanoic acid dehalogenase type II